jgi:hypothetical protein
MKVTTHRISIPSILEVGKGNIGTIGNSMKKCGFKKVSYLSPHFRKPKPCQKNH